LRHIAIIQNYLIKAILLVIIVEGMTQSAFAWSNIVKVNLQLKQDSFIVTDSACVFSSIKIYADSIDVTQSFIFNSQKRQIIVPKAFQNLPLEMTYRQVFFPAQNAFFKRDKIYLETENSRPKIINTDNNQASPFFQNNPLHAAGNLSRSMSVGSVQGLLLNSQLNLQLKGPLGRGYSLQAAMTDDNIPIQSQGSTQQLQDFDQVYVAVKKDSSEIIAGDFLMQTNGAHRFLKYYKKSRGMHVLNQSNQSLNHREQLNVALSRGRFNRMEIQGIEGVQGPYKLQGQNAEQNVLVISGTEAVYVNGVKLQRGQQFDYTIDYNLGELYFMPSALITQFSRIVVEFQYSDRQYLRSVTTFSEVINTKRSSFAIEYFSEQDHKQQVTDTNQRSKIASVLSNAGDESVRLALNLAYSEFQSNRINYRKIDSLGQSIFVYTNDAGSDTLFYVCQFNYVGAGKGHYKAIASTANGRVFAWVAPNNGVLMGDYDAEVLLVAPKHFQMVNGTWRQQLTKLSDLQIDLAYSHLNQNTYSLLDKANDDGLAGFIQFKQIPKQLGKVKFSHTSQLEKTTAHFTSVERYRSVEFNRLWNRQLSNAAINGVGPETVLKSQTQLTVLKSHQLVLDINGFQKSQVFKGIDLGFNYLFTHKALSFSIQSNQMKAQANLYAQSAYNHIAGLMYKKAASEFKFNVQTENSLQSLDSNKLFTPQSFLYKQMQFQWVKHLLNAWQSQLEWTVREDYRPSTQLMQYTSTSKQMSYTLLHNGVKGQLFKFQTHYRLVHWVNQADLPVLLVRLESNQNAFKKALQFNTYYQVSAGREQKRIYTFAPVQSGYGTHVWIDYNQNGLEELNEFELAVFKDQANYVKVILPSNDLVSCQSIDFNQSIKWAAPIHWQQSLGLKKILAKFQSISSFKNENKVQNQAFGAQLNPLSLETSASNMLLANKAFKQALFYNRYQSKFGLEYNYLNTQNKQLMTWGFDQKSIEKHSLQSRLNLFQMLNLMTEVQQQFKALKSDLAINRQYKMMSYTAKQELVWQYKQNWRLGAYAQYTQANNAIEFGAEQAKIKEFGLECRFYKVNKGTIDCKWAQHQIQYNGQASTPLAFDVLNGLSPGLNQTWSVAVGTKTKGNIQLNLVYDGRSLPQTASVHVGRVEAKYLF